MFEAIFNAESDDSVVIVRNAPSQFNSSFDQELSKVNFETCEGIRTRFSSTAECAAYAHALNQEEARRKEAGHPQITFEECCGK
jgi:hypothetical protein